MKKIKIAPSILAADFGKINEELKEVEPYSDLIHVDVMDGHFVPNITMGPVIVKNLKTNLPIDCHLMIENPEKYVEEFVKAGATSITFHAEAVKDPISLIKKIKKLGCKAAVAINPDKSLNIIKDILDDVDMVLVMSVFPGFAGQKFIPKVLENITKLRELKPNLDIQIDGGLNKDNIRSAVDAGANIIVAASAIFKKPNRKNAISELRGAIK